MRRANPGGSSPSQIRKVAGNRAPDSGKFDSTRNGNGSRPARGKLSGYGRSRRKKASGSAAAATPLVPEEAGADAESTADNAIVRQKLCIEILTGGYVQSYVDFFYLVHRPNPQPTLSKPEAEASDEINVSREDMAFIKDNLCRAESARRQGETATVYECYSSLAEHFLDQDDSKTGIYFYEKCLEIARLTSDPLGEMRANHRLGLAYENLATLIGPSNHNTSSPSRTSRHPLTAQGMAARRAAPRGNSLKRFS